MAKFNFFTSFIALSMMAIQGILAQEEGHSNYAAPGDSDAQIMQHYNLTEQAYHKDRSSYYLFFMNDYNRDRSLDGHEIRASLHATQVANKLKKDQGLEYDHDTEEWDLEKLNEWVDQVLREDDVDNDGLISLAEYLASQIHHNQKV